MLVEGRRRSPAQGSSDTRARAASTQKQLPRHWALRRPGTNVRRVLLDESVAAPANRCDYCFATLCRVPEMLAVPALPVLTTAMLNVPVIDVPDTELDQADSV